MTINGLMTQRTGFLYAMPMSRMRENFVTERQAQAAVGGGHRTTAAERSAGDSRFVDRLPEKDNSAAAAQGVAATQSAMAMWAMRNPDTASRATPAITRTPGSRRAVVEQVRAEVRQSASSLQNITSKIFSTQINGYAAARNYESWSPEWTGKVGAYAIQAETAEQADRAISADGYWGAAQTSERIVKYAEALAGGDSAKVDAMEQAFEQGYQQAEKAWGGEMPAVAQQTREAVLNRFQALRESAAAAAQAVGTDTPQAVAAGTTPGTGAVQQTGAAAQARFQVNQQNHAVTAAQQVSAVAVSGLAATA